ncbi:hypothetical protein PQR62_03480 [Herbaspirillum lusitanum]|uniref:Lipoprotein n=1 Tax=Herbaspirillum lusitanum TaxID=213312 RepID=A0ABW9A341_9BURK
MQSTLTPFKRAALTLATLALLSACATPEERAAKRELKQQRQEVKAQAILDRANARTGEAAVKAEPKLVNGRGAPLENVFTAFAACNASLFKTGKQFATELEPLFPMSIKNDLAYIKVNDRKAASVVAIGSPANVFGVPVSAYFDQITPVPGSSDMLSWGFFSPMAPQDVVKSLSPYVLELKNLSKDINLQFIRLEIYDGKFWRRTSQLAKYRGMLSTTAQRSLTVAPSDNPAFPGTRIACSLQGKTTPDIVNILRPDLQ